jgi:hypothetical protein
MDKEILDKINHDVYAQFPYLQDVEPKILEIGRSLSELRYQYNAQTSNGITLPIVIKVIADDQGNIQKMVTSR